VIWGTLMVIPIEESLIYVRPLYLRSSGGKIPELTRVIVAYDNRIVMEKTLEAGLASLFGGGAAARPPAGTDTRAPGEAKPVSVSADSGAAAPALSTLADEARTHYDRAVQAQQKGDWATYGEELRQLGQVLQKMKSR